MLRNKIRFYQLLEIIAGITKNNINHEIMDFYWQNLSAENDDEILCNALTDIATKANRFPTVWEIEKTINAQKVKGAKK